MGLKTRLAVGSSAAVMTAVLSLLPKIEGTEYKPYIDVAGVPTVCSGITGPDVIMGKTYTQSECDSLLLKHTKIASDYVHKVVTHPIPPSMEAALVSFTYNVGRSAFGTSTVLRLTNQGKLHEACNHLYDWVYITRDEKKVKSKGLYNRRSYEFEYCVKDLK